MNESSAREWHPSKKAGIGLNIAGLALFAAALFGYAVIWGLSHSGTGFSVGGSELLIGVLLTLVITAVLLVVHEGIHGLVFMGYRAKPKFGVTMVAKVMPALYCTAPGTLFTKAQFLIVALAPTVVLGIGLALLIVFVPGGGWLVIPAATHLAGCIGDIALSWVAARQPKGTMIEDLKTGMRFV